MDKLQLLRPKEVTSLLGISIATLYRWESKGQLPFPKIKIGPGAVGFRQTDVREFIEGQTEEQEKEPSKETV